MKLSAKISIGAIIPIVAAAVIPPAVIVPNIKKSEAHIVNFNDLHGAAAGYGDSIYKEQLSSPSPKNPGLVRVAKVMNDILEQSPNTMFLAAGDSNSSDAFSSSNHAEYLFPILKGMDVRYSAVGNHAFEWGLNYMSDKIFDGWARTDKTEGNYFIAANILNGSEYQGKDTSYDVWKEQKVKWADPYKIVDMNGHNICLIGLTTKLTKTDGNKAAIKDLSFINYNASVSYAKQYIIDTLGQKEFNKIDAFILLTHIGSSYDNGVYSDEAFDLATKDLTTHVDAIISAHSHKEGTAKVRNINTGDEIWVGQAGTAGRALLDTKMKFDDTRAPGSRLESIEMKLHHPYIDTAGINMDRKDLTPEEKAAGLAAAEAQYQKLLDLHQQYPTDSYYFKAIEAFNKNKYNVITNLKSPVNKDKNLKTEVALSYHAKEAAHLGHEFYAAKTINEPMGAWTNKANIIGTDIIRKVNNPNAPSPAISLINIDSLTHTMEANKAIQMYDIYQLQTYENPIYQGVLTVGQLANIIDYMLSGGMIKDAEVGEVDPESAFIYGADNREYDKISAIELDPITKESIELPVLKDAKGRETKLRYLCGPLQFYGFKFEVEKLPQPEVTSDWKNIRQYKLHWENGAPRIWIYDPQDDQSYANIDNTSKWKLVGTDWPLNKYIPLVINSFTWTGGNYQNTMIKEYMIFNAKKDPNNKAIQVYDYPAQFTRDALLEYCKAYVKGTTPYTLTLTDNIIEELVKYI